MSSKKNIAKPEWALRVRAVRGVRTQAELAYLCGVSQMTISRWESGKDEPSPEAYATLASLCDGADRKYFWERSGYEMGTPEFYSHRPGLKVSRVPTFMRKGAMRHSFLADLLRGEQARDENQHSEVSEAKVSFYPQSSLLGNPEAKGISLGAIFENIGVDHGVRLSAARVADDSMAPIIPLNAIVGIDTSRVDPAILDGHIVALREWVDDKFEIVAKRLRRDGDTYMVVGEKDSRARLLRPTDRDQEGLLGEVVFWIVIPIYST